MRAQHWLHHSGSAIERYLKEKEKDYYRQLYDLAEEKCAIDSHYAQHIPPAAALMVFAIWHLILVNVYAI